MTFEVFINDNILFYPTDEAFAITNGVVETALNEAGTFECDVPAFNPMYAELEKGVRRSTIQVKQNGVEIFFGEVREVTQNFDMTKHIYAVGELAYLFDSIQPQKRYQTTPLAMFTEIIKTHNAQVNADRQFEVGYVTVKDNNNYVYHYTNYEDTLTAIRDKMCDTLDGVLRIRKVNNKRYIDLVKLSDYGKLCRQEIEFGENLIDYVCNTSTLKVATECIPLGQKIDDLERTKDAVDGLDEYLTIKSVNNGKDYVQNDTAVNAFGHVRVVKHWDDVTEASNLKKKAEEWLKSVQFATIELQINAFDSNLLDVNIEAFNVGDQVHAWALPFGMDTYYFVRKKTTYINDITKNFISLGTTETKSYTSQASKALSVLEDKLPEEAEYLKNAKANALNMLTDPSKGYVTYVFDDAGNRTEIWIADSLDNDKATKKWVWNSNGLGYLYYDTKEKKWKTDVAITMDGKIVADFITTGTMLANRIKGGTLSLGGKDNGNGQAYIYTSDGKIVSSWDNDGITFYEWDKTANKYNVIGSWYSTSGLTIKKGSININNMFQVSADGKVDIDAGTININGTCFSVDANGKLSCTDATLTGNIKSSGHTTLTSTADGYYLGEDGLSIGANFSVDAQGNLTSGGSASFTGSINSGSTIDGSGITGGTISGTTISGGTITSGDNSEDDTAGSVTISSGKLEVRNGTSGYMKLEQAFNSSDDNATKGEYVALGGSRWYTHYYENGWHDRSFNNKELFKLIDDLSNMKKDIVGGLHAYGYLCAKIGKDTIDKY